MYGVVGTDGVVYGPVPVAALFEWIAQGRVVPGTILIDWQGRQIPAAMIPELQGAFPLSPPPSAPPLHPAGAKRKSVALGLAFLVGFLGAHRLYLGHTRSGVAMLALNVAALCFTADLGLAILLFLVTTLWLVADMAMIASGRLMDAGGRPLV